MEEIFKTKILTKKPLIKQKLSILMDNLVDELFEEKLKFFSGNFQTYYTIGKISTKILEVFNQAILIINEEDCLPKISETIKSEIKTEDNITTFGTLFQTDLTEVTSEVNRELEKEFEIVEPDTMDNSVHDSVNHESDIQVVQISDDDEELVAQNEDRMPSSPSNSSMNQENTNSKDDKVLMYRIRTLKCTHPECKQNFSDNKQRMYHIRYRHNMKPFPCLISGCTNGFDSNYDLAVHMKSVHKNMVGYNCNVCLKFYRTYKIYRNHHKNQHDLGIFECSYTGCDYFSNNRYNVINHHELEHSYAVCPVVNCGKIIKSKSLHSHKTRIHGLVQLYRCTCAPECAQKRFDLDGIQKHIEQIHLKEPLSIKRLRLFAQKCSD